jgi:hypothetical protein
MDHMFYETIFKGNFDFGDKFSIKPDTKKDMIFTECIIDEDMIDAKYGEDFAHIRELLNR